MSGSEELRVRCDQFLLQKSGVFVYAIPLKYQLELFKTCLGKEAGYWARSDPKRVCRLSVKASRTGNKVCLIQLQDEHAAGTPGQLFAESVLHFYPAKMPPASSKLRQRPALDSTRFFTLQIMNYSTGKRTFVGLGFVNDTAGSDQTQCLENYFAKELPNHYSPSSRRSSLSIVTSESVSDSDIETGSTEGGSTSRTLSPEPIEAAREIEAAGVIMGTVEQVSKEMNLNFMV